MFLRSAIFVLIFVDLIFVPISVDPIFVPIIVSISVGCGRFAETDKDRDEDWATKNKTKTRHSPAKSGNRASTCFSRFKART
jgi:hypothetical protein